MSQKFLGEFFEELAQTGGIEVTDELKATFKGKDFAGAISEDLANQLRSNLLGRQSAMHDRDIRSAVFGEALGTFDTKLKTHAKNDLGLTHEEWDEIRSKDKSAINVLPLLLQKAKEKGMKEASDASGLNLDELKKKVKGETEAEYRARLEANANTIRDYEKRVSTYAEREKELQSEWEQKFNSYKVGQKLAQKLSVLPWRAELSDLRSDIMTIQTQKLMDAYVWKEEGDDLVPYRKDDPAARAMDGGKVLKADDVIRPALKQYLNLGGPPATTKTGTAPARGANGDKPKRKLPDFSM